MQFSDGRGMDWDHTSVIDNGIERLHTINTR